MTSVRNCIISASSAREGLMLMGLNAVAAKAANRRAKMAELRHKEGLSGRLEGIVSVMFKKFQLVTRFTRHALATGVCWCVNLYMVFAGAGWQMVGAEFGVMFTGEIKK